MQRPPSLVTFDVYGTLMDVREGSRLAFARILAACGGQHVDPLEFWEAWEQANIRRYWAPYHGYREICRASLEETLAAYRLRGDGALIRHYFDAFRGFRRFPDVEPALRALARVCRLGLVSNIDDDLLAETHLDHPFDLVCTAQQARGYKADGTLFRHLLSRAGCPVQALLHCGQSQHTDMVGAKPLGIAVAWINRRGLPLAPGVPAPDHEFRDLSAVAPLVFGATSP